MKLINIMNRFKIWWIMYCSILAQFSNFLLLNLMIFYFLLDNKNTLNYCEHWKTNKLSPLILNDSSVTSNAYVWFMAAILHILVWTNSTRAKAWLNNNDLQETLLSIVKISRSWIILTKTWRFKAENFHKSYIYCI